MAGAVFASALLLTLLPVQAARASPRQQVGPADANPVVIRPVAQNDPLQRRGRNELLLRRTVQSRLPAEMPWAPERLREVRPGAAAEQALRDLDAPEYATREAGTRMLLSQTVRDEEVYALLSRAGLSGEQHARLLDAAQRRILDAPRGALGIQMSERFGEDSGVTVTGVIRGMPAEGVLRPGDRIVEIDREPVLTTGDLVEIVQNMRPGERVRVVVMRGERDERGRVKADEGGRVLETRVEVEMPLGSAKELERLGDGNMLTRPGDGTREIMVFNLRRAFMRVPASVPVERRADEAFDTESHPDIVEARKLLARPRDPTLDAGVYGMMQARLAQLEAAARATNLTDSERAWLDAVVKRYREIMLEREPARLPVAR